MQAAAGKGGVDQTEDNGGKETSSSWARAGKRKTKKRQGRGTEQRGQMDWGDPGVIKNAHF